MDSRCLPRDSGTAPCRHMIRGLWRFWPWSAAASSEGQKRQARRGCSSRTSLSPCYSCSPEDSSARGRHSTPPEGPNNNWTEADSTRRPKYFWLMNVLLTKISIVYLKADRTANGQTLTRGQQPHSPLFSLQQVVPAGQLLLSSHLMSVTAPG